MGDGGGGGDGSLLRRACQLTSRTIFHFLCFGHWVLERDLVRGCDTAADPSHKQVHTPSTMSAYARIRQIKRRLANLHARDAEAAMMIERGQRLKAEVAVEIEAAEAELASAVAAPVERNEDPMGWLPNELVILVLWHVVELEGCRCVCTRWHTLCRDRQLKDVLGLSRWQALTNGTASPRAMSGHSNGVWSLAVGRQG